jgi:hypothetical protein
MFRSKEEERAFAVAKGHDQFHWEDLARGGVPASSARTYLHRWEKAGLIEPSRIEGNRRWYRMAGEPSQGARASNAKTPEDAMWALMRRSPYFTPTDLVAICAQIGISISEAKAQNYCQALLKAKYLRCIRQHVPGRKPPQYCLINDTGPSAPQLRRVSGLVDQNTGAFTQLGARS